MNPNNPTPGSIDPNQQQAQTGQMGQQLGINPVNPQLSVYDQLALNQGQQQQIQQFQVVPYQPGQQTTAQQVIPQTAAINPQLTAQTTQDQSIPPNIPSTSQSSPSGALPGINAADLLKAPPPFNTLKNRQNILDWINRQGVTLSVDVTKYPSMCTSFPRVFAHFVNRCTAAGTGLEKNAIAAKMVTECLWPCNPVLAQMEVLIQENVNKAFVFFNKNPQAAELSTNYYTKYLAKGAKCENPEELKIYNASVSLFREYMNYQMPEAKSMDGTVDTVLSVGNNSAALLEMLNRMNKKRRERLGIPEGQEAIGKGVSRDHIETVRSIMEQDFNELILVSGWKDGLMSKNSTGKYLLATGLNYMTANRAAKIDDYLNKLTEFLSLNQGDLSEAGVQNQTQLAIIYNSYNELRRQMQQQSEYYGQVANIDPVWLTFFIAFRICHLTPKTFYDWQRAMYSATRFIKGKTSIKRILTNMRVCPGIPRFLDNCSVSGEIYLPPWIMTLSRIYDVAATIGCCDCKNAPSSIKKPSISWRYFLMLNYAQNTDCLGFIAALDAMEGDALAVEKAEDIRLSEKILQQIIVGRDSPLANTNHVIGNALKVKLT